MENYKRRFGDRYDGRLIRSADPFFKLIPYIMRTRTDSQVFFNEELDLDAVNKYLNDIRESGIKNIGILHIVIAAIIRVISQKPGINRFIAGQKIYARNEIQVSLAIKKGLSEDSPETTLKMKFNPTDTIYDVVNTINDAIQENKSQSAKNDTDKTARIISICPGFLIKFIVWFISKLDYFGIMPKAIYEASPFHTSVFVTDMGSIGIESVFHHIYNFGTTSVFIAFGIKQRERVINKDSSVSEKQFINIKAVVDERIVDGYYYASAFRLFKKIIAHPEKLDAPPEKVVEDIQ